MLNAPSSWPPPWRRDISLAVDILLGTPRWARWFRLVRLADLIAERTGEDPAAVAELLESFVELEPEGGLV